MSRFRQAWILIILVVTPFIFRGVSAIQGSEDLSYNDAPIYDGDTLTLDAQAYAIEYGVSLDEAIRRLKFILTPIVKTTK